MRIIDIIFRAVVLAMGVSVVVLSILNKLTAENGMVLIGIGLTCAGITLLNQLSNHKKIERIR